MDIKVEIRGKTGLVNMSGRLEGRFCTIAERETKILTEQGVLHFVFDFSEVLAIDSQSMIFLTDLYRSLQERGGGLRIVNLSQPVSELFQVLMLDEVLDVQNSVEEALQSFV